MKTAKWILIVSMLLFVCAFLLASQLGIESNMVDMLPKDSPTLAASEAFNTYFTGQDQIIVLIQPDNEKALNPMHSQEAIHFMDALAFELQSREDVASVFYVVDPLEFQGFAWAYAEIEDYRALDDAIMREDYQAIQAILEAFGEAESEALKKQYMTNANETHYMMLVQPIIDEQRFMESRETFYDGVQAHIATLLNQPDYDGLEVGLTGGAFIQDIEGDRAAFDGIGSTLMITLILIIVVVILFFGKIKLPLLTLYPLLLGALLAAASAFVIYRSINMFAISFALLLVGLGIDYAVHLIARYQEELSNGIERHAAVKITVRKTGGAIIIGALTTAFAFSMFAWAEFKAFEQMGIVSAVGILWLCLTMLLIVPAIMLLFDQRHQGVSRTFISFKWLEGFVIWQCHKPILPITILVVVALMAIIPIRQVTIESDLSAVYPEDIPSVHYGKVIETEFDYNTNTISTYVDDMEQMESVMDQLKGIDAISSVVSIMDYMPTDQMEKLETINRLKPYIGDQQQLLKSGLELRQMNYEDLPASIKTAMIGKEGKLRLEIVPSVNLYDLEAGKALADAIYEVVGRYPVGMPMIMNEVTQLVQSDILKISIYCMVVALLVCIIMFKSIRLAIITITPVALTLYFTFAFTTLVGVQLNLFSIAALPLIIGIGIDSGIHLIHRLISHGTEFVPKAIAKTGQAIMLTTATTMIGFGSLSNINHPGLSGFGILVAIGMAFNLILTLSVIPICYYRKSNI